MDDDRSAALLLRVWLEEQDGRAFRARLTAIGTGGESGSGDVTVAVAASPEEALAAVRTWLDGFLAGAQRPVGS